MTLTSIEENYIRTLYAIAGADGGISPVRISRELRVQKATVTCMMRRLMEKGMVAYEPYKAVRLTDSGKRAAEQLLLKNRLVFDFAVGFMGLGPSDALAVADEMEHLKVPAFFSRIRELLKTGT